MPKITPFLWFDDQAEAAAEFYTSVFKNSQITDVNRYDAASAKASGRPEGSVLTAAFELDGQKFIALNGGPGFKFSEAVSFVISCKDQAEIDYYWSALSADPASEQCGWLKDKFGLSWQVVPENLPQLLQSPAAMAAMLKMKKLVIADLENAT